MLWLFIINFVLAAHHVALVQVSSASVRYVFSWVTLLFETYGVNLLDEALVTVCLRGLISTTSIDLLCIRTEGFQTWL